MHSVSPGRDFVEENLGSKYVMSRSVDFAVSFEESGAATPMFFILSPGVDPLKDVEKHGTVGPISFSVFLNLTVSRRKLFNGLMFKSMVAD